jgi:chemotaxis protein methyltransferase CheR
MRINDFDFYKDFLMEKSGLALTPDKSYLLDSRLTPVAKKWNFDNLEALTMALRGVPSPDLIKDVVESMTTNETSFFRDNRPFDMLKETVLPTLIEKRSSMRKLSIWCAASSTGQEPYSIAMILKETQALAGWNIDILGTDISTEVIEQAQKGEYSQFEVQRGLPIQMLMNYFEQMDDGKWKLKPEITKMVAYKYFNLLENISSLGKFDVVFCRNVLIYFDKETKAKVLAGIEKVLAPDGFLFLGGAETVIGITDIFKLLEGKRGVYVKSSNMENETSTNKAIAT